MAGCVIVKQPDSKPILVAIGLNYLLSGSNNTIMCTPTLANSRSQILPQARPDRRDVCVPEEYLISTGFSLMEKE